MCLSHSAWWWTCFERSLFQLCPSRCMPTFLSRNSSLISLENVTDSSKRTHVALNVSNRVKAPTNYSASVSLSTCSVPTCYHCIVPKIELPSLYLNRTSALQLATPAHTPTIRSCLCSTLPYFISWLQLRLVYLSPCTMPPHNHGTITFCQAPLGLAWKT